MYALAGLEEQEEDLGEKVSFMKGPDEETDQVCVALPKSGGTKWK